MLVSHNQSASLIGLVSCDRRVGLARYERSKMKEGKKESVKGEEGEGEIERELTDVVAFVRLVYSLPYFEA